MSDIVEKLRAEIAWEADVGELLQAAADEIDRLREAVRRLAEQDATLSVSGGAVTVTLDATLTAEEREAIHHACGDVSDITGPVEDTLRGLLERTGGTMPVFLGDLRPGLFVDEQGFVGFKSEYYVNDPERMEVFCVDTGEAYWGGTSSARDRAAILVYPASINE